jgi:hypothetical protein
VTLHGGETLIAGDEAQAEFRLGLSGTYALELLQQAGGRLLVQLAVGAGKTEWLVRIIVQALTANSPFDLVIVLVPRWDVLRELVQRLPPGLPRTVLHPRPRKRCGDLDATWVEYEAAGCSLLGKEEVCALCPRRLGCAWPRQYGSSLRGVRLVLATQQHLAVNPRFVQHLRRQAQAARPLVLLDESDFLARSVEQVIPASQLEQFVGAQEVVLSTTGTPPPSVRRWLNLSQLVAEAPTADLRQGSWKFPFVANEWAVQVQREGRRLFGPTFRFVGFDLQHFGHSDVASRSRLASGDLHFAVPTDLGKDFVIFSGSMARDLARYRLDPNHAKPSLASPFENYRFEHPGTRWYNLNLLAGAAKFFPKNADRILDFFARKIAGNISAGRRTLLIARKKFFALCRTRLRACLAELGAGPVQVVSGDWKKHDLTNPRVLPLISYGVCGVNLFQHHEAAYCLTAFYVSPVTLAQAVQDMDPAGERFPITIDCGGRPRRRRARVRLPDGRATILPFIAEAMLEQKEGNVVVQAVGRVRPFTSPREVFTLHTGTLPGVRYTQEFESLTQVRAYFGIPTPAAAAMASKAELAWRLRAQGRSNRQIAQEMGVSLSTAKRYLKLGGGHSPFSLI